MLQYGTKATCDVCGVEAFHETGCNVTEPSNWGTLFIDGERTTLCPKCTETIKNCIRTMIVEKDIFHLR